MRKTSTKRRRPVRRTTLSGWWKCVPLVALPFCIIFFETWLRTQILTNQYEMNVLSSHTRELRERVDELKDEQIHLRRMERIDAAAPDLGLVEPKPGQIVLVRAGQGMSDAPTPGLLARSQGPDKLEMAAMAEEAGRVMAPPMASIIEPAIEPVSMGAYAPEPLEPLEVANLDAAVLTPREPSASRDSSLDLLEPLADSAASMD